MVIGLPNVQDVQTLNISDLAMVLPDLKPPTIFLAVNLSKFNMQ